MVDSKLRWKGKLNPDFINLISCHTTHVIPIPHTKNTITLAPFTRYPKMFVYGSLSFYLFYLIKKENCQLAVTKLSIVSLLLFLLLSADCFITFYLDSFSMRLVHPLSCFNLLYCREKIQTFFLFLLTIWVVQVSNNKSIIHQNDRYDGGCGYIGKEWHPESILS